MKRDGQTRILHEGQTAVIDTGVWHDWWNASDRDARVRVEVTPGERFVHMIETFFGLARLGHTNGKACRIRYNSRLLRRSSVTSSCSVLHH